MQSAALDAERAGSGVDVTREVAGHLARLARGLEGAGHCPEEVARFLMRCGFTMFAESIGLLPGGLFSRVLGTRWIAEPGRFSGEVVELWTALDRGGAFAGEGVLRRFGGGLFRDASALPLGREELERLLAAARCDWADVEPAIFGALIERALDPRERQRLGAHYTPRAYVERLVRPTIEAPLREAWDGARAEVRRLVGAGLAVDAREVVRGFHRRLCEVRVLDPACGAGNFLYVAFEIIKGLEGEVLGLLGELGGAAEHGTVTPATFLGIEKKRWAAEIAGLVLWIGFLRWHARERGGDEGAASWPEPALTGLAKIECRDALLLWDRERVVLDARGEAVTRWDGFTNKVDPVSGAEVPDERARVPVSELVGARRAEWPRADFIVGNPPFIGNKRMRLTLGDGYVAALRGAYADVPENVDLVMYWWHRAAGEVGAGRARSFGLVTTNSITQASNRRVLADALCRYADLRIAFAIPDHPWVDPADGAAVRIAMTCARVGGGAGQLLAVVAEEEGDGEARAVRFAVRGGDIHADLTCGVDLAGLRRLGANRGLACPGVQLSGQGFVLDPEQARALTEKTRTGLVRGYVTGRDLVQRRRGQVVLDTFGLSEGELEELYPDAYRHLQIRVKPERLQNPRANYRRDWWLHSEPRSRFRRALVGLPRIVVTSRTARHRVFQFLEGATLAETKVLVFAFSDAFYLGVLSSRAHVVFAAARGGWLGVGNDSTYNHSDCFDPFPFPAASEAQRAGIRALAEELDAHRKARQAEHPGLTMTGMYNVLERLRAGEGLREREGEIHAQGQVAALRRLHDDLDAAVFAAYGWPTRVSDEEIVGRLAELNARRAEEERGGLVRWLRPELCAARGQGAGPRDEAHAAGRGSGGAGDYHRR
jgi:hypothetical protein